MHCRSIQNNLEEASSYRGLAAAVLRERVSECALRAIFKFKQRKSALRAE